MKMNVCGHDHVGWRAGGAESVVGSVLERRGPDA
jgi:hypothetical protein